jgi:hypothetical protein
MDFDSRYDSPEYVRNVLLLVLSQPLHAEDLFYCKADDCPCSDEEVADVEREQLEVYGGER